MLHISRRGARFDRGIHTQTLRISRVCWLPMFSRASLLRSVQSRWRHVASRSHSSGLTAASSSLTNGIDGDRFRTRLPDGRLETFRLYFADTTESRSRGNRSDEQAAYSGITHQQAIELWRQAAEFTARALEKPFTFHTRWSSLFGASGSGWSPMYDLERCDS